jgi:hypothetical protein
MKLKKLSKTQNGKAPGLDNIPPELLKEDTDLIANILCNLFEKIWKQEKTWKNGEKAFYSNYQRKEIFLTVQIEEELHYFL